MTDNDSSDTSSFLTLDNDDQEIIGPNAILLCGFSREEAATIEQLVRDSAGASEHKIICCTTTMGTWNLESALNDDDGGTLLPVGKVPRVMVLSGLNDRLVSQLLDAYGSTGLERPIFAVATQSNLSFTVIQLLEDLMAERRTLV